MSDLTTDELAVVERVLVIAREHHLYLKPFALARRDLGDLAVNPDDPRARCGCAVGVVLIAAARTKDPSLFERVYGFPYAESNTCEFEAVPTHEAARIMTGFDNLFDCVPRCRIGAAIRARAGQHNMALAILDAAEPTPT